MATHPVPDDRALNMLAALSVGPEVFRSYERFPDVGAHGYLRPDEGYAAPETMQIALCAAYLRRRYYPAPDIKPQHGVYSYALKHEVERAVGGYVTNGAAILAARALDVTVIRDGGTPNGWLLLRPAHDEVRDGASSMEILDKMRRTPFRQAVAPRLRAMVLERDGFRCRRCGSTADDGVRLVIDHIEPVARGGLTVPGNLQTLCEPCNQGKRDHAPHAHDRRPFAGEADV